MHLGKNWVLTLNPEAPLEDCILTLNPEALAFRSSKPRKELVSIEVRGWWKDCSHHLLPRYHVTQCLCCRNLLSLSKLTNQQGGKAGTGTWHLQRGCISGCIQVIIQHSTCGLAGIRSKLVMCLPWVLGIPLEQTPTQWPGECYAVKVN